jgi:hypothetical protein
MSLFDLFLGPATPRCAGCQGSIQGRHVLALGRAWHAEHFLCGCCARPLGERFLLSPHQEPYCAHHLDAVCQACGHLARPGCNRDGFCAGCTADTLSDPVLVAALLAKVQGHLRAAGLPWWPHTFPVRLVGPEELRLPGSGHTSVGLILKTTHTDGQGRSTRQVREIRLLRGRPTLVQGAVLAHELGHAWIFQKGLEGLPADLEEGFCEYCAHLWLGHSADPRAPFLQGRLQENPDPVYGGGFRLVRARIDREGLTPFLAQLATG